jgi:hypothetical protein
LVLVGVAVPVRAVRLPGLLLADRSTLDAHALRQVVLHVATLLRRPPLVEEGVPGRSLRWLRKAFYAGRLPLVEEGVLRGSPSAG